MPMIFWVLVSMKCAMLVVSDVQISVFESGETDMPSGSTPTGMLVCARRFSMSIAVTIASFSLAT